MRTKKGKFTGKSEQVADLMLKNFEDGDIPKALAQVFVKRTDDTPSANWSWRNRLIMALSGTFDARGYKMWKEVGRCVEAGSHAIYILAPMFGKKKNDAGEIETLRRTGMAHLGDRLGVPTAGLSLLAELPLRHREEKPIAEKQ